MNLSNSCSQDKFIIIIIIIIMVFMGNAVFCHCLHANLVLFCVFLQENIVIIFFLTNQWLQPLGHVSPSPSPAEVKIKALSSQAEEGSLLTAAPGCVESSFISRGNLTFAGPKEFNKDPRPPARPQPLTLLTAAVSDGSTSSFAFRPGAAAGPVQPTLKNPKHLH